MDRIDAQTAAFAGGIRLENEPVRTWRPMLLWAAAIVAAAALTWFVASVVVPVCRLRAEIAELGIENKLPLGESLACLFSSNPRTICDRSEPDARSTWLVARMGGPKRVSSLIRIYLALPAFAAPNRATAVYLLGFCGPHGIDDLIAQLERGNATTKTCALEALYMAGPEAGRAVPRLKLLQEDQNQSREIRELAMRVWPFLNDDGRSPGLNCLASYGIDRNTIAPMDRDLSQGGDRGDHGYLIGELDVQPSFCGSSNYGIHVLGTKDDRWYAMFANKDLLMKVRKGCCHKFYGVLVGSGHKGYMTALLVYEVATP